MVSQDLFGFTLRLIHVILCYSFTGVFERNVFLNSLYNFSDYISLLDKYALDTCIIKFVINLNVLMVKCIEYLFYINSVPENY